MFNACVLNHPHHAVMAPDLPELLVGRCITLHGQTVPRQGPQFHLSHEVKGIRHGAPEFLRFGPVWTKVFLSRMGSLWQNIRAKYVRTSKNFQRCPNQSGF